MVSLVVHAILGLVLIGLIVASNPKIFARPANGPRLSALECAYYAIGIAGTVLGYYFNTRFVAQYATGTGIFFWGPGSWAEFISLGTNPAASNASQDYTLINVVLLPLFTIVDGCRRGIRRPWLFFVTSLFTSCAFRTPSSRPWSVRRRHRQAAPEPARTVTSGA